MTAAALGSVAVSDAGEYADLAAALLVVAYCLLGWLVGVAAVADLLSGRCSSATWPASR